MKPRAEVVDLLGESAAPRTLSARDSAIFADALAVTEPNEALRLAMRRHRVRPVRTGR